MRGGWAAIVIEFNLSHTLLQGRNEYRTSSSCPSNSLECHYIGFSPDLSVYYSLQREAVDSSFDSVSPKTAKMVIQLHNPYLAFRYPSLCGLILFQFLAARKATFQLRKKLQIQPLGCQYSCHWAIFKMGDRRETSSEAEWWDWGKGGTLYQ